MFQNRNLVGSNMYGVKKMLSIMFQISNLVGSNMYGVKKMLSIMFQIVISSGL